MAGRIWRKRLCTVQWALRTNWAPEEMGSQQWARSESRRDIVDTKYIYNRIAVFTRMGAGLNIHADRHHFAASFLEYSGLSNDRRQRPSSDLVAQSAATFGVERNHTDASATQQDRGRGQSESARHTQYAQRDVTLRNPLYNAGWSIKQEEYRPLLYIETHFFRNFLVTSFRKLPETSRTFRTILDYSRSFWILLDRSPAQRSSPEGSLVHAQV